MFLALREYEDDQKLKHLFHSYRRKLSVLEHISSVCSRSFLYATSDTKGFRGFFVRDVYGDFLQNYFPDFLKVYLRVLNCDIHIYVFPAQKIMTNGCTHGPNIFRDTKP
jgi:hypothetical protein